MSNAAQTNAAPPHPRRALIVAGRVACDRLCQQLTDAGYKAQAVNEADGAETVAAFAPHIVIIELTADADGGVAAAPRMEFARLLRAMPATMTLPLVFLYERDAAALRAAAISLSADDYFSLATPPREIVARLDALLWRVGAKRNAVQLTALEQRAEIGDFLQLLDAVRADIERGAHGALALIADGMAESIERGSSDHAPSGNQTLAAAQTFFKLNLRRIDAVAFYGPTLLLAYLPRRTAATAETDLTRLAEEFRASHAGSLRFGIALFPADDREIESLIERAEATLKDARTPTAPNVSTDISNEPLTQSPRPQYAVFDRSPSRAVRESGQDDAGVTSTKPAGATTGGQQQQQQQQQGTLTGNAAHAAAHERERRARGAIMPRRLLLTISDPARMAQVNLLLRSAGYEVRAAFDGLQAINLLRIERPDLLVIDHALNGFDGLEALRRLHRQHHGRLPLPVVLLISTGAESDATRAEAGMLGARGFVNMPYDAEELLAAVRVVGSAD